MAEINNREQDHERIRAVCAQVPLIDAHAHNVVELDSNLPFLVCLREARGLDAVRQSLAFQVLFLRPVLLAPFSIFSSLSYIWHSSSMKMKEKKSLQFCDLFVKLSEEISDSLVLIQTQQSSNTSVV
jgi:hypothetical protein